MEHFPKITCFLICVMFTHWAENGITLNPYRAGYDHFYWRVGLIIVYGWPLARVAKNRTTFEILQKRPDLFAASCKYGPIEPTFPHRKFWHGNCNKLRGNIYIFSHFGQCSNIFIVFQHGTYKIRCDLVCKFCLIVGVIVSYKMKRLRDKNGDFVWIPVCEKHESTKWK